jgi:hypothetical protein
MSLGSHSYWTPTTVRRILSFLFSLSTTPHSFISRRRLPVIAPGRPPPVWDMAAAYSGYCQTSSCRPQFLNSILHAKIIQVLGSSHPLTARRLCPHRPRAIKNRPSPLPPDNRRLPMPYSQTLAAVSSRPVPTAVQCPRRRTAHLLPPMAATAIAPSLPKPSPPPRLHQGRQSIPLPAIAAPQPSRSKPSPLPRLVGLEPSHRWIPPPAIAILLP